MNTRNLRVIGASLVASLVFAAVVYLIASAFEPPQAWRGFDCPSYASED